MISGIVPRRRLALERTARDRRWRAACPIVRDEKDGEPMACESSVIRSSSSLIGSRPASAHRETEARIEAIARATDAARMPPEIARLLVVGVRREPAPRELQAGDFLTQSVRIRVCQQWRFDIFQQGGFETARRPGTYAKGWLAVLGFEILKVIFAFCRRARPTTISGSSTDCGADGPTSRGFRHGARRVEAVCPVVPKRVTSPCTRRRCLRSPVHLQNQRAKMASAG